MNNVDQVIKASTANLKPQNRILGVSGSPRKNGNSDALLRQIIDGAGTEGVQCITVRLRDLQFQGCIGCERCRKDGICTGLVDGLSVLYSEIISARGLVLVSPTHHYNITSWMKAFVDRLYCFYRFGDRRPGAWSSQLANQGRKAVITAVCEQENRRDMGFTLDAMRLPLEDVGYDIIGEQAVLRTFERGRISEDRESLEKANDLGQRLARSLIEYDGGPAC